MEKLRALVVQEPVVAASCLIATFGLVFPLFVKPFLRDSSAKKDEEDTKSQSFGHILVSITGPRTDQE